MSSFNVHKSRVIDSSLPLQHRMSHLRSCLNKIANLTGCKRDVLIEDILIATGVNVECDCSEKELMTAFEFLLRIRLDRLSESSYDEDYL